MIVTEHVHIHSRALEKINLNHAIILFDDIKNTDLNLLTINKKCIKNTNTVSYEVKHVPMQSNNGHNIDGEVSVFLKFSDSDEYIIDENENKYLVLTLTENNKKEVLEPYKKLKLN